MTMAWPAGSPRIRPVDLRTAATLGCAILSVGAAVIHFSVVGEHWREWWGYGLFFVAAGWLQLAWAAAVAWRPSRAMLLLGAAGSLAIALLWLVTRTAGIPLGPASGEAEEVTFIDTLASGFELAIALGATAAALSHFERWTLRPTLTLAVLAVAAIVVLGPTTAGLVDNAGEPEEHQAAEGSDHSASAATEQAGGDEHGTVAGDHPAAAPPSQGEGYYP